jgi:phage terminase large subunit-like protein
MTGRRDYVKAAIDYANNAVADESKNYCKWIKLAAKRFLADLDRCKNPECEFVFEEWFANNACSFIEKLPHVEGTWDTPTIVLHPAHIFFVVQLFGFRNRESMYRRYTSAVFAVARKNAKSTLAAAILLYCLTCEDEVGPQVISAATTGDQAKIIFGYAKRMVEKTPDFQEYFNVKPFAKAIACFKNGGNFRPINAKASTQDGLNPSAVGLDEIHAHKSHDLINVLKSAAGGRRNPLYLYTTTEGYENPGPWGEIRHFGKQVLQEILQADHFLVVYYAIDDDDNEFDSSVWIKANPLMTVNPILATEIAKEAIEAKAMPGKASEFKIKRCNRPAQSATGEINLHKWKRCNGEINLDEMRTLPCYVGLDLASTMDMASMVLLWRKPLGDGTNMYYCKPYYWVPDNQVKLRKERGIVGYEAWVKAGYVCKTPGDAIDYAYIEKTIYEVYNDFGIKMMAYDMWRASDLVNRLSREGIPLVQFIQGFRSYSPAFDELEIAYTSGKLAHAGNPVLAWNASNLVARRDVNLSRAPDKEKSADKIDGMCSLMMAFGLALADAKETSVYENKEMLVL